MHNHDNHAGCSCHEHTHSCHGSHEHEESKIIYIRLALGIIIFIAAYILKINYLFILPYLILGYDVIINGILSIFKRKLFSEQLLMTIASVCAMLLGEFAEGCAVMLFYQIGELFCDIAEDKSEKSIKELVNIMPEYANLEKDGASIRVPCEDIKKGDIIYVSAGEKIPSDGIVISGTSQLDTSAMTGESEYRQVTAGDEVISGVINCGSLLKIEVTKAYCDSSVAKVNELLEKIEENKSKSEKFLTVFSKYYTPIVIILAILTFLIPTLAFGESFSVWGYRALVLLVVSCPCALVISVPLTFFASHGCASKAGVLIKGSMSIEKLAKIKTAAFDKTGTLTKGSFKLEALRCNGIKSEFLTYLAYAEFYSTHPLSDAVVNEYKRLLKKEIDPSLITDYTETGGYGICVKINSNKVLVGSADLMRQNGIEITEPKTKHTVAYMSINGKLSGYAEFTDGIKSEASDTVSELKAMKIKTVLLSGDKHSVVKATAEETGISEYYSELLPQDKVSYLEALKKHGNVAFVGDGINDAPVIALSDVGIAMGLNGSDSAIAASDAIIMSDNISSLVKTIKISKKAMHIVWQNIIFSITVKIAVMVLGIIGAAGLWPAVFGDVGVSIIAILNSLRALKYNDE